MTQIQLSQVVDHGYTFSMKVFNIVLINLIGMMHLLEIISNLFLNFVRSGKKKLQYSEESVVQCDSVKSECGEHTVFNRSISEIPVHTTESEIPSAETDLNTNQSHNCYTLREDGASYYEAIPAEEENTHEIKPLISYDADKLYSIRSNVIHSNYKPAFLFDNFVIDSINKSSTHVEKSRIGTAKRRKAENPKLNENLDMIIDLESSNSDVDVPTIHKAALKPKSYADVTDISEKKIDVETDLNTDQLKEKTVGKIVSEKKLSYPKKKQNTSTSNSVKELTINASTDQDWRRKGDSKNEEDTNDQKFKWYNRRDTKRSQYQPAKRYTRENP